MLRKKEVYTTITPIPSFIPRQLAIDILHSHSEVITLNPLVTSHKPIPAPRNAAADEYYSTWYEIQERIQWVPGMGRIGSGKISFNGCFHDMPWGLQTHIFAPMNVDLRNKYRVEGNQSGLEPPNARMEMGLAALGAPADGLYLREDIEIRCNIAVVGYVKAQLKAASKEMVARIIKKAELLDSGVLHAMLENGKLKTFNPNDRTAAPPPQFVDAPPLSPAALSSPLPLPASPGPSPHYPPSLAQSSSDSPRMSVQSTYAAYRPPTSPLPPGVARPATAEAAAGHPRPPQYQYSQVFAPVVLGTNAFPAEMLGDTHHYPAAGPSQQQQSSPFSPNSVQQRQLQQLQQQAPGPHPSGPYRVSTMSTDPQRTDSVRTSVSSDYTSHPTQNQASPGLHGGFSSELPVHEETQEEHKAGALERPDKLPKDALMPSPLNVAAPKSGYVYNPRDYAAREAYGAAN